MASGGTKSTNDLSRMKLELGRGKAKSIARKGTNREDITRRRGIFSLVVLVKYILMRLCKCFGDNNPDDS
jgi:hypothetical protein